MTVIPVAHSEPGRSAPKDREGFMMFDVCAESCGVKCLGGERTEKPAYEKYKARDGKIHGKK